MSTVGNGGWRKRLGLSTTFICSDHPDAHDPQQCHAWQLDVWHDSGLDIERQWTYAFPSHCLSSVIPADTFSWLFLFKYVLLSLAYKSSSHILLCQLLNNLSPSTHQSSSRTICQYSSLQALTFTSSKFRFFTVQCVIEGVSASSLLTSLDSVWRGVNFLWRHPNRIQEGGSKGYYKVHCLTLELNTYLTLLM